MRDYYKTLGVKETASEEEIRERWIELTKHHHPDREKDIASDKKIREINEAYQVLKHSSTRVEYDLKRTYGYERREEKRRSYSKRVGISAGILITLLILGGIYLRNYETPSPELTVSKKINLINSMNSTNPINSNNSKNLTSPENSKRFVASKSQPINSSAQKLSMDRDQIKPTNPTNPINPINPMNSTNSINPTSSKNLLIPTAQAAEIQNPPPPVTITAATQTGALPPQSQNSATPLPDGLATPTLNEPTKSANPTNLSREMGSLFHRDPINPADSDDPMLQLAQFKPPSLLAREDEVKKFFNTYIDRYNRMDIEGFLSLFSPKAIQNKKDGPDGIRKIYTDFFNQGKEVRNRIQEMKIEIYQNVVEVRAHYEIEQILKKGGKKKAWRGQIQWVLGKENGVLKIISLDYQHQKTS
jgi:curved DNA-binding protein CbpA